MLKRLFRKPAAPPPPNLDEEIATAAQRLATALREERLDPRDPVASVESYIEAKRSADVAPPADITSDLAAFLGEHARTVAGGSWGEDPLFGLSILQTGGIPHAVLGPYQLVRKKWQLGPSLSLQNFFANLPARLASEASRQSPPLPPPTQVIAPAADFARVASEHARTILARDLGTEVPATLVGLRTAERWLRGHFLLRTASIDDLHRLGFLVGEVMRGLYGGEWNFHEASKTNDWSDAALIYPELLFLPVGRVLKLLVEQPEGNGLDDYVRLIPAARKDMRKGKDEG